MVIIKLLQQKLTICVLLLSVLTLAVTVIPAAAQDFDGVCDGVRYTSGTGCDAPGNPVSQAALNRTITNVLNAISGLIGVAAVVMIIMSGYRYIIAGGDSSKISSAQQGIIYGIIGLVIVAMAQIIARFALQQLG